MIPKVIHYCWFGGNPLPELAKKCIKSWKKYCPDYEIIEWNESNFDFNCCDYAKEAYQAKKWAFVSDVARMKIIYEYGGIYLDVDVEVIKPLDDLLLNDAYFGFEADKYIATGLGFGACKGNELIGLFLDDYYNRSFVKDDGSFDTTPCPQIQTSILLKFGLIQNGTKQIIKNATIFPTDFFCPLDYNTGKTTITSNTYSIHHFNASWVPLTTKLKNKIKGTKIKLLKK